MNNNDVLGRATCKFKVVRLPQIPLIKPSPILCETHIVTSLDLRIADVVSEFRRCTDLRISDVVSEFRRCADLRNSDNLNKTIKKHDKITVLKKVNHSTSSIRDSNSNKS